jgi:CspA family cold shock protein
LTPECPVRIVYGKFFWYISFHLSRVYLQQIKNREIVYLTACLQAKELVMSIGTVKWFNSEKGYGFITPDDGSSDLFVHHSEVKTTGYANLEQDQKVNFEVGQGKKGPCANSVTLL